MDELPRQEGMRPKTFARVKRTTKVRKLQSSKESVKVLLERRKARKKNP
jgi:hypothetical protein